MIGRRIWGQSKYFVKNNNVCLLILLIYNLISIEDRYDDVVNFFFKQERNMNESVI